MSETLTEHDLSIEEYGKKGFLRPVQRQELERSISGIEERLAQPILLEITGGDRDVLAKQLVKEQTMLERGTPPKLDMAGQRRVYQKMQKCEEMIINGLPTFTMMNRGRPQDVDHFVSHENAPHRDEDGNYTTKRAIQAWKNYRLTLDPHSIEPNFLSIASLRTDTVRGNPELFRKNYDHIKFREYIEDTLVAQLDDETYYQFCGIKVLGWTEATIRRKFDWTQKMYDAAMERWRTDMEESVSIVPQPDKEDTDTSPGTDEEAEFPVIVATSELNPIPVKRGPHRTHGAILSKAYEPRVQIEPGWPKEELHKYGIGVGEFCKAWGQKSNTLFYSFVKNGQWVERHLKAARTALEILKKKHVSGELPPVVSPNFKARREPSVSDEPVLAYDSAEPVSV